MAVRRLSGGLTPELGAADGQAHQGRDEEHPGMRDPAGDTRDQDQHPDSGSQPVQQGRGECRGCGEGRRGGGQQQR